MESAPDLKEVYLRTYDILTTGDTAAFDRLTSHDARVVVIGTDPDEWWTDPTTLAEAVKAQGALVQSSGMQLVPGAVQAYREGSVGWVIDRPRFRLPDGRETEMRATAVFHQEQGEWKLVHSHYSLGVPNAEVPGFAGLTTS
jgi:ketosteroid isomerase-like protein